MRKTLSRGLQKYYLRKGNRIFFTNKMTLNQLSWEMWDRLGYKGIDPSVLSRVLKGERLFTPNQLKVFCKVLKLSKTDRQELEEALFIELNRKFGLDKFFFEQKNKYFLDLVEDNLKKIKETRVKGLPIVSAEWADNLYERIHGELRLNHDIKKRKLVLKSLARLIIEQTEHLVEIKLPSKIYTSMLKLTGELKEIGKEIRNNDLIGIVHFHLGDSLYVGGKYRTALKHFRLGTKSGASRNRCLREAALCHAYLGNQNEFETIRPRLFQETSSLTHDNKFIIFERLSRIEANLGHPQAAYRALVFAEKASRKNNIDQVRKVQLTCAKIEIALLSKSSAEKIYLRKIGKEAIISAKEHGYIRHEQKMKNLLCRLFDK